MTLRIVPLEETPAEFPPITVEATCHRCGRLVFSEMLRASTLENYGALAQYWRDLVEAHASRCTTSARGVPL